MHTEQTLQHYLLRTEQDGHILTTVFLMNGFQMRGQIVGFDDSVVILESEGRQQMIFKHAISTIVPFRAIPID